MIRSRDVCTVVVLRTTRVRLLPLPPSPHTDTSPPRAGPILGWLNVVEAHLKTDTPLPVNLRFCFEGMEESGSEGLEELVIETAKEEWKDVDAVCISDNYWSVSPSFPLLLSSRNVKPSRRLTPMRGQARHHLPLPHLRPPRSRLLFRPDSRSRRRLALRRLW